MPRIDVDPDRDRAILILSSASAEPFVTHTDGCTAHELDAWESSMPANFGGDGYSWWKAYYIVPTVPFGSLVDFDASGSAQYMNWYTSEEDLAAGEGTYGDGVDLEFVRHLFYGGSGTLVNEVTDSLTSQWGDCIHFFQDYGYRTFDDLLFEWTFKQGSEWDRSGSRFNAIPFPIDWHLFDTLNDGGTHTVDLMARVTVTPGGFPGAARALATLFAARLHAIHHC